MRLISAKRREDGTDAEKSSKDSSVPEAVNGLDGRFAMAEFAKKFFRYNRLMRLFVF